MTLLRPLIKAIPQPLTFPLQGKWGAGAGGGIAVQSTQLDINGQGATANERMPAWRSTSDCLMSRGRNAAKIVLHFRLTDSDKTATQHLLTGASHIIIKLQVTSGELRVAFNAGNYYLTGFIPDVDTDYRLTATCNAGSSTHTIGVVVEDMATGEKVFDDVSSNLTSSVTANKLVGLGCPMAGGAVEPTTQMLKGRIWDVEHWIANGTADDELLENIELTNWWKCDEGMNATVADAVGTCDLTIGAVLTTGAGWYGGWYPAFALVSGETLMIPVLGDNTTKFDVTTASPVEVLIDMRGVDWDNDRLYIENDAGGGSTVQIDYVKTVDGYSGDSSSTLWDAAESSAAYDLAMPADQANYYKITFTAAVADASVYAYIA